MKILIVEDNEDSRIYLETLLAANGYQVESAENGKIALALAKRQEPSLIISDILMPEMDGYALCRAVKSDEKLRRIPFVFYTATYTDPKDEKLAMDIGASRFLVKPMEIDPFLMEVKTLLENHEAGKLQVPETLPENGWEFGNAYAGVLARKLDQKVRELDREKQQMARVQESLQQAQKMEAIGTLAGGIAHDFNNILTPIIGYTEMTLLDLPKDSSGHENLQQVLAAAHRARKLARHILTFSRHTEKDKEPVLLQDLINESLNLLRATIPSTIEIREAIDPHCHAVTANATQMHQIVMNLCTNAYHAMRDTGGILAVSLSEMDVTPDNYMTVLNLQPGTYLRLEISDTGTGIDKDKQDRIFEPYFTTKSRDEGTGLGLSVVHGIVTSHGGHISVYSEPGEGAVFHVYLPVVGDEKAVAPPLSSRPVSGGTERILVVDDDEIIGNMEKAQLERFGYQVTVAGNGKDALAVFRENDHAIDLVITDMTMPHLTGVELVRELRKIRPTLPIILCTGFSDLIDKEKALDLGIKKYLMKPVGIQDLARAVRCVLDQK